MLLAGPKTLFTEADTAHLAASLADRLVPGDTVLLRGPVGAGKSAFARALIRARLGDPQAEVPSPTFTLVQTYGEGDDTLWHADLYRLSHPEEVLELGLAVAMEEAICLIEWPDRLGPLAPPTALVLDLAPSDEEARVATFSGSPEWKPRLEGLDA
ncbi:tRNA (adenosine(37)-N6)-threonylcarbamoyltransferase complex ATPase subunit type 1 TsaE [Rubellimicrobium arenae]|uniref:tRNA (adenosine(37)-N6)-threonylcarbamoyltransferase complex ATPase subunit type 1 TsaE n=1 Tax=Rubellimicrobium arenae TaxID=2817372 RepID=UPI001B30EFE8|nr:tRNA (adenosine(37)-N6)-threonylcarbamoyltransferase complex ATPase subunit type 1 TsaE [Rubellimicrobium arenae]